MSIPGTPSWNLPPAPKDIFSYKPFWAKRLTPAPFLPMSGEEMEALGWDSCDVIVVTGDAYVDHPSFGMAIVGRVLEAQGFRVGILSQPDWTSADPFRALGRPNLFFGITAGNMDSMVNRYTSDRRIRSDDAYTPGGLAGKRPDRSVIVYAQRAREAYPDVPIVIGGIEASLRRIAHYDHWSEKVRRSVLVDSQADLLLYGNAERALVEVAQRLAARKPISSMTDIRGTTYFCDGVPDGWKEIDSTTLDTPGRAVGMPNPYLKTAGVDGDGSAPVAVPGPRPQPVDRSKTVVRLPSFETVAADRVMYAHASRVMHLETNPGNARALIQRHGDRDLWVTPPPIPLTSKEMDGVYELPYQRLPHPFYAGQKIPAYEMIRFSVTIQRGCFGGCTFCSITEHEGRIIQNRSEDSVVREIERMRDTVPGFTGQISDLGGPTANMYRIACKDKKIESACRRPSCVFPGICENLNTNHKPLIELYRRARAVRGVKKVSIASGVRYDLASKSPEYIKELATHHVGGYLKIAPEHTENGPLDAMMKPGIETYERFKEIFDKASREAGKEQYVIPYFIAAHPGTTDKDMLELALWLKRHDFRADQVQAFLPTPMTFAAAMYHTGMNPMKRDGRKFENVYIPRTLEQRRLHKAFLRWHDANNWPLLRSALKRMGRMDLIGNGKSHLVPAWQPKGTGLEPEGRRGQKFSTQHTRDVWTPKTPPPPKNPGRGRSR
ncbi:MAG TPA: YgiQ family radical SAM protein [Planctomycetota bacterium]|nr:YgiQ family radical SAM protein [Planctomycetota bacterium]